MNQPIMSVGKKASFTYLIEGKKGNLTASLFFSRDRVVSKDFTNKERALKWIDKEVDRVLGEKDGW